MNTDMVSIVMGTYNPNIEYLETAVKSIINQSYSSWELLLLDDGSENHIASQIRNIVSLDSRIHYIREETNKGLAHALNKLIGLSTGQFIARMDDDDISMPDRIRIQVDFLQRNPKYAWVGCEADLFDDTGVWGRASRPETPDVYSFLHSSPFIHPSVVFRRCVLVESGGYCEKSIAQRCEDYELFMRLYASGHKGYNIKRTLFQYRDDSRELRRTMLFAIREMQVRIKGFRKLKILSLKTVPYVTKPILIRIAAIMPRTAQKLRTNRRTGDHRIGRKYE